MESVEVTGTAPIEGPFRVLDVPFTEIADHGSALDAVFEKRLDILLVRGVFQPEETAAVVRRLEAGEGAEWRATLSDKFRFYSLGRCLDMVGADRSAYFEEAVRFRADCEILFREVSDYETRLTETLRALGGGCTVEVPPGEGGGIYMPSTIRFFPDKGYIPPHCEFEQLERQGYGHLLPLIDPANIISFYVMLQTPQTGGEIVIYALQWADLNRRHVTREGRTEVAAIIERWPSVNLRPAEGDLIIFDGGRLFHRVAPVGGPRKRWTIGGFCSRHRDGTGIVYWS